MTHAERLRELAEGADIAALINNGRLDIRLDAAAFRAGAAALEANERGPTTMDVRSLYAELLGYPEGVEYLAPAPEHASQWAELKEAMVRLVSAHDDKVRADALKANSWKPISTVPMKTTVLVIGGHIEGESTLYTGKCDQATKVWTSDGVAFLVTDTTFFSTTVTEPTHWQPLPAPPEMQA